MAWKSPSEVFTPEKETTPHKAAKMLEDFVSANCLTPASVSVWNPTHLVIGGTFTEENPAFMYHTLSLAAFTGVVDIEHKRDGVHDYYIILKIGKSWDEFIRKFKEL